MESSDPLLVGAVQHANTSDALLVYLMQYMVLCREKLCSNPRCLLHNTKAAHVSTLLEMQEEEEEEEC